MPKDPIAPLIVANEKEKDKTWEELNTPTKMANWFARVFAVDLGVFKRIFNLLISPNEPKGGDRGKVHVKTSRPIGVGFPVQGKYTYIYQYPPNVPMQMDKDSIPLGIDEMTVEELSKFGLSNGTLYRWVMLKP